MPPLRGARSSWEVFASTAVLEVSEPGMLAVAEKAARAELEAIDAACSRFRADSELSRLNASAGRPVAVGPLLTAALELAWRAASLTDGAVDPTIGESLRIAGYDRDWKEMEADSPPVFPPAIRVRRLSGWRSLRLDPESGTAMVPSGVSIDLGATAKAWAADRAALAARAAGAESVLVAVGGDIATAGPAPDGGWRVRVTDDHRAGPEAPGQTIELPGGGLATSGTTVRRWRRGGEPMHHIIDPARGCPAESPWRTVSVAAASCADANIAATAALVKGAGAPDWLGARALPARLVRHDGEVICMAGWPEPSEVAR